MNEDPTKENKQNVRQKNESNNS